MLSFNLFMIGKMNMSLILMYDKELKSNEKKKRNIELKNITMLWIFSEKKNYNPELSSLDLKKKSNSW